MNKYKLPHVKTFEYTKIIGINHMDFGKYVIIDDYVHIAPFTSISRSEVFEMENFTATDDFNDFCFEAIQKSSDDNNWVKVVWKE